MEDGDGFDIPLPCGMAVPSEREESSWAHMRQHIGNMHSINRENCHNFIKMAI